MRFSGILGDTIGSLDCLTYPHRLILNSDIIQIDMKDLRFVHPSGVIGLLCFLEKCGSIGKNFEILLPIDAEVCDYFSKIDLLTALQKFAAVSGDTEGIRPAIDRVTPIIPVMSFSTRQEVDNIAQIIEDAWHDQMHVGNLLEPCYTITVELAINVVEHSETTHGWVLAQKYEYPDENIIEIAVGDSGIGVRRSLRSNPKYASIISDDVTAIKMAVSERVTRYRRDPLRGCGLSQICSMVGFPDRRLTIRSGQGCLVVYDNGRQIVYNRQPMVGVLAEVRIPC